MPSSNYSMSQSSPDRRTASNDGAPLSFYDDDEFSMQTDREFSSEWSLKNKTLAGSNEKYVNDTRPLCGLTSTDESHHNARIQSLHNALRGTTSNARKDTSSNAASKLTTSTNSSVFSEYEWTTGVPNVPPNETAMMATRAPLDQTFLNRQAIAARSKPNYSLNTEGTTDIEMRDILSSPSKASDRRSTSNGKAPSNIQAVPTNGQSQSTNKFRGADVIKIAPTASHTEPAATLGLNSLTGGDSRATTSVNPSSSNQGGMRVPMTINNNLTLNAGYGSSININYTISTTGYDAQVPVPTSMPSTSETSNLDPNHTRRLFEALPFVLNINGVQYPYPSTVPNSQLPLTAPSSTSQQPSIRRRPSTLNNSPAKRAAPKNTSDQPAKGQYQKQQLPAPELYKVNAEGQFICRYKGPARRGRCSTKNANIRNLGRHLRKHAIKEDEMQLPLEDRVACNGMPEGLLLLKVSCPFKTEDELVKCKYYRENGKPWEVRTLERWEKVMERHKLECHA